MEKPEQEKANPFEPAGRPSLTLNGKRIKLMKDGKPVVFPSRKSEGCSKNVKEDSSPISKTLLMPSHAQPSSVTRCESCPNLEEVVSNLQKEIRRLQNLTNDLTYQLIMNGLSPQVPETAV